MKKEPTKIRLTETPITKEVKKIPLPSINPNQYDIDMRDDVYIKPDTDSIYKLIKDENNSENNSQSISELESYETD
jgi:hypothetical protein